MRLRRRIIPHSLVGLSFGFLSFGSLALLPVDAQAAGMPQLDFSTPLTVSQVVWGAIIFLVLYIVMKGTALPMVASVLEERAGHIHRDLESARAAKVKADAGMEEAAAATAKARAEAQAAIGSAVEEAKASAAAQAESLNAQLEARLKDAETQIAAAQAAAMGAIREVATDTAGSVITRLTGAAPDAAKLDSAIGTALSARGITA